MMRAQCGTVDVSAWSPDGHFGLSDGSDTDATVAADELGEAADRR